MRPSIPCTVLGALILAPPILSAQEPSAPPAVLNIWKESLRIGRAEAHATLESRWADTYRRAGVPVYWLGANTMSGPTEAWFLSGLDGMAQMEALDRAIAASPGLAENDGILSAQDAENISGGRAVFARYRPDLSRPGQRLSAARFMEVFTYRVRPGQESRFEEAAKLYATVSDEAGSALRWSTYQVFSGMPGPAFLVIVMHHSLAGLDPGPESEALQKAVTPARMATFNRLASEGYLSVEGTLLRLAPRMSHLPPEIVAEAPGFWGPPSEREP